MQVIRYQSPADFLSVTEVLRSAEIVRTNLISSIANSVANGFRVYEAYYWWAVKEGDKTLGIAIRTAPYGYVFSAMPEAAIKMLMKEIQLVDPEVKEYSGPKPVINEIERILKIKPVETEGELIYELHTLSAVAPQGNVRLGTEADHGLISDWMKTFIEETGISTYNLELIVKDSIKRGSYYLLEVEARPVSLGGFSAPVEVLGKKVGRIGPIYTPIEFRKRGYATVITSYLTLMLFTEGAIPTLYTQVDNPTSNKIYQNLGYELVDEIRRIKF